MRKIDKVGRMRKDYMVFILRILPTLSILRILLFYLSTVLF